MRRSMRLIAVLLVVGAVGFGASAAFGTTGSSTAGSLSFSVNAPDTASAGQTVAYSTQISNTSLVNSADAMISVSISGPGLNRSSGRMAFHFAPGKSLTRAGTFKVPANATAGQYTVTLTVNAASAGQGQAQASTTLG
ncbi:MAG TPA: NEW3 domain-containing protein [Gaiellaceae bacterium]|jgi:hypothetical protein|nr:NEW3 domain-containing protein [Gaiellaceae bacterium]